LFCPFLNEGTHPIGWHGEGNARPNLRRNMNNVRTSQALYSCQKAAM
jgi:hypothetical protein